MENKTKTFLFASLIAALIIPLSGMAYASTYGSWTTPDHDFYCTSSLTNNLFHTGNISVCGDLTTAADKWNSVWFSDWDFTSGTISADVPVYACNIGDLGYFQPIGSGTTITGGWVCISENYEMGDVPAGDSNSIDYITLLIHEFGHVPGLSHSTTSGSVMEDAQGTGDVLHNLHWTDQLDLQGLY